MEIMGFAGGSIIGGVTVSPVRVGDGQCGVLGAWGGRSGGGSFLWWVAGEPGTGSGIVFSTASGSPHCPQA